MVLLGSNFTKRLRLDTNPLIYMHVWPSHIYHINFILFRLLVSIPFKEGRKTISFYHVLEVMNIRLSTHPWWLFASICAPSFKIFLLWMSACHYYLKFHRSIVDFYFFSRELDSWMTLGDSMLLWHEQDMVLLYWETLKFWASSLSGMVYWLTIR